MTLLLRPQDHTGILDIADLIDALEQAYTEWGEDPTINAPRHVMPDARRLAVHQATVPFLHRTGVYGHTRNTRLTGAPLVGGKYHAGSFNWDLDTGLLDAIVLEQIVGPPYEKGGSDIRTSATSAVGTKRLARANAHTIGVLGSGRQARTHLFAMAAIRDIQSVKVYSPNPDHREAYARQMSEALGFPVKAVSDGRSAVQGVDIVLVATGGPKTPSLHGEWLEPGQHVTSCYGGTTRQDGEGRPLDPLVRDLDDDVITRSDLIYINSKEEARNDLQGDMIDPIQRGVLTWDRVHELPDLLLGKTPGRTSDSQITLYKNNGAPALADIVTESLVIKRARELGRGLEV
ncbi:MAG: hypothetical protein HW416_85 [Chloroflexi bacterium]|nr:hypothetical protein [Chloroflexota bacterium]